MIIYAVSDANPTFEFLLYQLDDEEFDRMRKRYKTSVGHLIGAPLYYNSAFEVFPEPAADWKIKKRYDN